MSLCHVRLVQLINDDTEASYAVESIDFDPSGKWVVIGRLVIDKAQDRYEFQESDLLRETRMIPPIIYGLNETERRKLLQGEYKEFGWGAWSMTIHHYAQAFIEKQNYPLQHPAVFFD